MRLSSSQANNSGTFAVKECRNLNNIRDFSHIAIPEATRLRSTDTGKITLLCVASI